MSDSPIKPSIEQPSEKGQLGKLLVELGPLVVFFVVNSQAGKFIADPHQAIFWGTGAFMAATLVALIASRAMFGRVPVMPLISGAFVIVFGGLTLFMQDELFIKFKPTLVNTVFAAILLVGLATGRPLLKYLFGEVFSLTEIGWKKLTFRWAMFFLFLAALNEVIWRNFSTDFWIGFKVFGIMPITIAFAIVQVILLEKHKKPAEI